RRVAPVVAPVTPVVAPVAIAEVRIAREDPPQVPLLEVVVPVVAVEAPVAEITVTVAITQIAHAIPAAPSPSAAAEPAPAARAPVDEIPAVAAAQPDVVRPLLTVRDDRPVCVPRVVATMLVGIRHRGGGEHRKNCNRCEFSHGPVSGAQPPPHAIFPQPEE